MASLPAVCVYMQACPILGGPWHILFARQSPSWKLYCALVDANGQEQHERHSAEAGYEPDVRFHARTPAEVAA